jgi:hypothetical protein
MCLYVRRRKIHIADRDIPVLKYITYVDSRKARPLIHITSGTFYEIGKTEPRVPITYTTYTRKRLMFVFHRTIVEHGYHSYFLPFNYAGGNALFVIPKGTAYQMGKYYEIVSERIKFIDYLSHEECVKINSMDSYIYRMFTFFFKKKGRKFIENLYKKRLGEKHGS